MKIFQIQTLFAVVLLFLLSGFTTGPKWPDADSPVFDNTLVPLHTLTDKWEEKDLIGLFAYDPSDNLSENTEVVDSFLDFHFQSHPTLILDGSSATSADEHKKMIVQQEGSGEFLFGGIASRSVRFLEIRFSTLAEFQRFAANPAALKRLSNLNFVLLRFPSQTNLAQITPNLNNPGLLDFWVFVSIDSSN